jgi:hypothetical protein
MKTLNQDIIEEETTRPLTPRPLAAESRGPVVSCPVVSLKRYWLAMNATALDAAIHALVLFCGVAGAHEATQWVPALNLQQLAWVFLIAFGRAMLAYLETHPVAAALAAVGRVPSPGVPVSAIPPCADTQPTDEGKPCTDTQPTTGAGSSATGSLLQ